MMKVYNIRRSLIKEIISLLLINYRLHSEQVMKCSRNQTLLLLFWEQTLPYSIKCSALK
jgi:hypothetical protein